MLIFSKNTDPRGDVEVATIAPNISLEELPFRGIPQRAFTQTYKHIFDLSISPEVERVKNKMKNGSRALEKVFELAFGLKTGDDSRFLTRSKATAKHKPLLRGEDVHKYRYHFDGEYVWYVPDLMRQHRSTARPGTSERFEQPKVLVRDTGSSLEATYDDKNFYVKDVLVIASKSKDKVILKVLTGLLNSAPMRFYYETSFPTLHVQRDELASLPIPNIDKADASALADLVEKCLNVRGIDTYVIEKQIDKQVARLYGLTAEEMAVIIQHR